MKYATKNRKNPRSCLVIDFLIICSHRDCARFSTVCHDLIVIIEEWLRVEILSNDFMAKKSCREELIILNFYMFLLI